MQKKFFKSGGCNGDFLRAIYYFEPNVARCFKFGANPEAIDLEPGAVIDGVYEITEKEFNNYLDSWIQLAKESIEEFNPVTEYRVIYKDQEIIGYSSRNQIDLLDFLEQRRGIGFFVKDEDGQIIASIGPEVSREASFTTWEL